MATVNTNGTLTADGTEQTLATVTDGGTFMLALDLSNMALGDKILIRASVKLFSGEASSQFDERLFQQDQTSNPIVLMDPIPAPIEVKYTLEQTAGTNRDFPWAVYEL